MRANREKLSNALGISGEWATLTQVHGCRAVRAGEPGAPEHGDALVTDGVPAAVMVADCVPVALVGETRSGVAHAGWRGLCGGVIEEALKALDEPARSWIGPGIGPCHFEVGPEVERRFVESYPSAPSFTTMRDGRRWFDLPAATRWVLRFNGLEVDDDPVPCTFCDRNFYSFRRDGVTGRQAVIVWR